MTSPVPAAILWDCDGSLFDTEGHWCAVESAFAAEHGVELPADHSERTVGGSMAQTVEILRELTGSTASPEAIAARMWDDVIGHWASVPLPFMPGAQALVDAAGAAGVPQGLVSTSIRRYLDGFVARLDPNPFAVIVGGDEVAHRKPHPEPYLTAASTLGVDITRCLVIEDSTSGVAAGLASGARVLAVPEVATLQPHPRLCVVSSLEGWDLARAASLFA